MDFQIDEPVEVESVKRKTVKGVYKGKADTGKLIVKTRGGTKHYDADRVSRAKAPPLSMGDEIRLVDKLKNPDATLSSVEFLHAMREQLDSFERRTPFTSPKKTLGKWFEDFQNDVFAPEGP